MYHWPAAPSKKEVLQAAHDDIGYVAWKKQVSILEDQLQNIKFNGRIEEVLSIGGL